MNRLIVLFITMFFAVTSAGQASVKRHIFEDAFNAAASEGVFQTGAKWLPYPAYSDREAWEKLGEDFKEQIISRGEKSLEHEWKLRMASTYLEYEKTGNRALMGEIPTTHIIALTAAELVEGKGRFLLHLLDGLWMLSQQYSWSHAQHTSYQSSRRTLPIDGERPITLHSSSAGQAVAFALYFFKEEFDKLDPSLAMTIKASLKKNIFDPFLDPKVYHWWMQKREDGKYLNNWTSYCTANVTSAFLLCEDDPERLLQALKQAAVTMDLYMNDIRSDGACDEGPSYWDMAVGKVYDFARIMYDASYGKMSIFGDDLFRRMGEFKSKTYFGDGYVMNFADGSCRDVGDLMMIFRFGYDAGSQELIDFALSQQALPQKKIFKSDIMYGSIFRILEALRYRDKLKEEQNKAIAEYNGDFRKMKSGLRADVSSVWYNETEYAIFREGDWTLAAKAGNNGESHNHNDVGSAILYVNNRPVLIDPGVATYTKETFGANRYTLWNNQSDWHNAPIINGCSQIHGREYAAKDVACDLENSVFASDISGVYPKQSYCKSWNRTWKLSDGSLVLTDRYELSKRVAADVVNFIVRGDVYLPGMVTPDGYKVPKGKVVLTAYSYSKKGKVDISFSYPENMTPSVTIMDISTDKRVKRSWGDELIRISFTSKAKAPLTGQYEFRVELY